MLDRLNRPKLVTDRLAHPSPLALSDTVDYKHLGLGYRNPLLTFPKETNAQSGPISAKQKMTAEGNLPNESLHRALMTSFV